MNVQELVDTARTLVADDKGLLALDESIPPLAKAAKLASTSIPWPLSSRQDEGARSFVKSWKKLMVCIASKSEDMK